MSRPANQHATRYMAYEYYSRFFFVRVIDPENGGNRGARNLGFFSPLFLFLLIFPFSFSFLSPFFCRFPPQSRG
jgi:hypothetical protein